MHHENFLSGNFVKLGERADGAAAGIHESLRLHQPACLALTAELSQQRMKARIRLERDPLRRCQAFEPTETDVVPVRRVFFAWITQSDD